MHQRDLPGCSAKRNAPDLEEHPIIRRAKACAGRSFWPEVSAAGFMRAFPGSASYGSRHRITTPAVTAHRRSACLLQAVPDHHDGDVTTRAIWPEGQPLPAHWPALLYLRHGQSAQMLQRRMRQAEFRDHHVEGAEWPAMRPENILDIKRCRAKTLGHRTTWEGVTNRNFALRSMKRRMSQGQAMRSIFGRKRVTQRVEPSGWVRARLAVHQ